MANYEKLLEGNKSFYEKNADFKRLTEGQKPEHIVVACSDSRVAPEIILNAKLGELFVIRSAGEVVDEAELATIEYGVVHLGIKSIIMLAHTNCGAVAEAQKLLRESEAGKLNFDEKAANSKLDIVAYKIYKNIAGKSNNSVDSRSAALDNLMAQIRTIEDYEPIRDAIKSGLKIISGMYDITTGRVELYV
ncbi:MAG: carbonic anhydrase [Candidatus Micrarchaeia archaeon]